MIEYYLIYDIEEVENNIHLPNFICAVKVKNGFQRIDNLKKYLSGEGGISEEIINPARCGYFLITRHWQRDLDKILTDFNLP